MATYTRKEFLGLSAVLAGGAGAAKLPVAAAQEPAAAEGPPDLAVVNARVYTVDDALPRAEAFAVRGDRFVAVGSSDDIRNLIGPGTEVIDAEGMTVTPGFIDTPLASQRRERAVRGEHQPRHGGRDPARPARQGRRHPARTLGARLHV